jgi:hypothetical protein
MDLPCRALQVDARVPTNGGIEMQAKVGDRIVLESERVGQKDRAGEVLEVMDSPLGVNLRVRWDDGHESEIRPKAGSARIVPAEPTQPG